MVNTTMSEPVMVKSLDFRTLEDPVFTNRFDLTPGRRSHH